MKQKQSPNPISLSGLGSSQLDLLTQREGKVYQTFIGAYVYLKNCNTQHTLLNKVVSIEPRYLLVNECKNSVRIKAAD